MRSTPKCDIIVLLNIGFYFMKTKIIYISGNEVFEIADIRTAFEEVRNTLKLDKNTVLFGVPVDNDDAGLMNSNTAHDEIIETTEHPQVIDDAPKTIIETSETITVIEPEDKPEPVVDEPVKKRGRARKAKIESEPEDSEITPEPQDDEKVVPILSVLSTKEDLDATPESIVQPGDSETENTDIEIIEDIVQETENNIESSNVEYENTTEDSEPEDTNEPDLEKLLSAMKPLQEDILDENIKSVPQETEEDEDNIDATLEQLATEFVQSQDKIASESKSSGRGRIGKLRNILPFKQSKHKDQGLGDLFGWAGVAANDEDFSVPGFFTNTSQKK